MKALQSEHIKQELLQYQIRLLGSDFTPTWKFKLYSQRPSSKVALEAIQGCQSRHGRWIKEIFFAVRLMWLSPLNDTEPLSSSPRRGLDRWPSDKLGRFKMWVFYASLPPFRSLRVIARCSRFVWGPEGDRRFRWTGQKIDDVTGQPPTRHFLFDASTHSGVKFLIFASLSHLFFHTTGASLAILMKTTDLLTKYKSYFLYYK